MIIHQPRARRVVFVTLLTAFFLSPTQDVNAQTVRVLQRDLDQPRAYIEKDLSGVTVGNLNACPSQDELDRYWGGKFSAYSAHQAKTAQCLDGWMQGALLADKIADVKASIQEIEKRITSMNTTLAYLGTFRTLDNFLLFAIPAGKAEVAVFEYAKRIVMQCIVDKSTGTKAPGGTGSLAVDKMSHFEPGPSDQRAMAEEIATENTSMDATMKSEIARTGKLSEATSDAMTNKALDIKKILEKNFVPIAPNDLSNYPEFSRMAKPPILKIEIQYIFDNGNQPIRHPIPSGLKAKIAAAKLIPGAPKIDLRDNVFTEGDLLINGVLYPKAWLPEQTVLNIMKQATQKHKERYVDLTKQFEDILKTLESKLTALSAKSYGCNP